MLIRFSTNSFYRKIIFYLLIFLMLTIFLGNYYNADYMTYKALYERYYAYNISYNQEIGFIWLNQFFISKGFSYFSFKNVLLLISFIIFIYSVNRIAKENKIETGLVILLYFLSGFLSDVIQIRMFLASSIVLLGISYLKEKDVKNSFIFWGLLFIGMTIHISTIIYASFYLIYVNKNTKFIRILTIIGTIVTTIIGGFLFSRIGTFFSWLSSLGIRIIENQTFERNFGVRSILLLMLSMLLSILCENDILENDRSNDFLSRITALYPMFTLISCFNASGGRFLRMVSVLLFVDLLRRLHSKNMKYKKIYILSLFLIVLLIGGAYWIPGTESFRHITVPILQNNYFFDLL